jgi:hypothetical protein
MNIFEDNEIAPKKFNLIKDLLISKLGERVNFLKNMIIKLWK